jgi:propanol-preferring alcohol dehydrogenase
MRAAIFDPVIRNTAFHLKIEDVPRPQVAPGYVLLRVLACGVCRTDLHIVEGDLPVLRESLIPGHQMVGEVIE